MHELTPSERTILHILQQDARTRLEDIASQAGASIPTVQRTIKRLKKNGIILGETIEVDPAAVGAGMTFLIMIELERERLHEVDAFRRRMLKEPQIQQCYYITGEADFALVALTKDMDEYKELTQKLFFDDSNVKRFRTSVVMERVKTGSSVPL